MSDQARAELTATDLPITLYLNQRLTFDLMAVLQGGFSRLSTVQTISSGGTATKASGEAQLGASNIFAFLGVKLSGQGSREAEDKQSESISQDKVHTPTSLFAQLRKDLQDRKLVRYVSPLTDLNEVRPSEFVEFEATLRRNPLIEILDSFSKLAPLMKLANTGTSQVTNQGGRRRSGSSGKNQPQKDEFSIIGNQINLFKDAITDDGSQDLIAEMGPVRVVLPTDKDYFIDPSMNDTIDGTFRVFGKTTRVISEGNDKISLLRKTALGKFGNISERLGPMMESMQDTGFNGPVETEIPGPALQVIPIAIFS